MKTVREEEWVLYTSFHKSYSVMDVNISERKYKVI